MVISAAGTCRFRACRQIEEHLAHPRAGLFDVSIWARSPFAVGRYAFVSDHVNDVPKLIDGRRSTHSDDFP